MTDRKKANGDADGNAQEIGRVAFVLFLLVGGIAIFLAFLKLRKPPEPAEQAVAPPAVEARTLKAADVQIVVEGYGTVTPKTQVEIVPEVAGKVLFVHSELKTGGVIPAHEKIVRIDPRDYELGVRQAETEIAEAQVRLDTELAEAEEARRQWRRLHPETEPSSPLVLREPQIGQARTALESAKARLAIAELRLERTTISLPFDVLIVRESIDLGQYVGIGQDLATAYGVEAFEIEVPLRDADLAWFDAFPNSPVLGGETDGGAHTPAAVHADFAGQAHVWNGYVARTTGQADTVSHMVPVVIEVPKPLDTSVGRPPLFPGTFVKVCIAGRTLPNALSVPRDAIQDQNSVWVVQDGRVHLTPLDIVRMDEDFAYVTSGLADGSVIATGALEGLVEGMVVEIAEETVSPEAPDPVGASESATP